MKSESFHNCAKKGGFIVSDGITGEIVCSTCGMVLKEKTFERSNDARTFSKEEYMSKTRTGSPCKLSMFDMGNSSMIARNNLDASGKYISKNKSHFSRLRLWDSRSKMKSKERGMIQAFMILDSVENKINLPENAKEHAAHVYRKAAGKKIIRGKSIRAMMSASIYASCKQLGIPRSIDEVAEATNINRKTLSRTYRHLVRKLELDMTSTKLDYVSKVANSVAAGERVRRISSKILDDVKKSDMHVGKNPIGLAAGAVYISSIGSGKNITMANISKKSKISTVTIRKIARLLKPFAAKYIETIQIT